jgi:hypothetical protein
MLPEVIVTCSTEYCKRKPRHGGDYCERCHKRRWREQNPVKSTYADLKSNAKRR